MTWITATGGSQTNEQSNLMADDAPRGPLIETSIHAEVIYQDGKSLYIDNSSREVQLDTGQDLDNGILASARTEGGGVIHGRSVMAGDQVMLPEGIPASATVAADLGYLVRSPDGTFSEAPQATAKETNEANPEAAPEVFSIGDAGEEAMTEIINSTDQGAPIAALNEALEHGEVSDNTLARMAAAQGIEPEQAAELVNTAHQSFYAAATDHMTNLGITDDAAFGAFVQDNPQAYGKLAEAARALVMNNDTTGLDTVAGQFMEQADHYMQEDVMEALNAAGFEHRPDGRGGLLVTTNSGIDMSFQVAVREGIVKFSQ